MTKRRNFSDQFKAAVALEALRGDKTVQEIAATCAVAANNDLFKSDAR
jgi:transposase-like protein